MKPSLSFMGVCLISVFFFAVFAPKPAQAVCACAPYAGNCSVQPGAADQWWRGNPDFTQKMRNYLFQTIYQSKIVDDWWKARFRPALQRMTAQIVSADVHMTGAVGGFLDGAVTNRAQLTMQELQAQALKNYTPGENMCRFGTAVRSLAASQSRAETTQMALAQMGQDRQLGTKGGSSDSGMVMDRKARIDQFTRIYCDPADNNGFLGAICGGNGPVSQPKRFNKDINFTRTLAGMATLDVDFTNSALTPDEEDLIALSSNLYGPDVLPRITEVMMAAKAGNAERKQDYLNLRQLVAFRNVAQNSFNAMAARRTRGTAGSASFLMNVLKEMGMSEDEAKKYLASNTGEPSYNAQMEVLTKKIYQNPNFYVNLVDKPANVDRQIATMEAFSLMQDRDVYQSLARQEMLLSLLLELKTRREQRDVERRLKMAGLVN